MNIATRVASLQPSYIREILAAATRPGVISLAGGLPAEESFPLDLMAPAIAGLASRPDLFQYGSTRGYEPLVETLTARLDLDDDSDLVVCTGSQQALDLVARTFLDPGDAVVMEAPSYLGALQVFQLAGARILTVEQTPAGPDPDVLAAMFAEHAPKLFYAVPDFHNPTGVCWSAPVRTAVAAACHEYGVTLVEDSPYRDIRFSGEPLPLVSDACPGRSILLRSFSKTVAPGLRLGVAAGPREWIRHMTRVKQAADLHTAIPQQALLREVLMHADYPGHLQRLCDLYRKRYHVMSDAIRRHFANGVTHTHVDGGMFLWMEFHAMGVDTMRLAERAIEQGVAVVPGEVFYPGNDAPGSFLRLNFSHSPVHRLDDAVGRIAACLD